MKTPLAALVVVGLSTLLPTALAAQSALTEASARVGRGGTRTVFTGVGAPRAPVAPPTSAELNDPARQEAITALRGVESVLAGGANTAEFKKYYLDAKIKVDALPSTPGNAPIREVSTIYADAITLSIAAAVQRMSAEDAHYLRQKYSSEPTIHFGDVFDIVSTDGFSREWMIPSVVQGAANSARNGGQMLLQLAGTKLKAVQ